MYYRSNLKFLLFLIIILLAGCGNNEFNDDYRNFKDSYLEITDVLDLKEPFTSIENLNKDPILKEIEELKTIVSKMNKDTSTKSEKRICDNISTYYAGIEFLQYASQNIGNLSEDERGRIATELTLIELNRNNIKQNEV